MDQQRKNSYFWFAPQLAASQVTNRWIVNYCRTLNVTYVWCKNIFKGLSISVKENQSKNHLILYWFESSIDGLIMFFRFYFLLWLFIFILRFTFCIFEKKNDFSFKNTVKSQLVLRSTVYILTILLFKLHRISSISVECDPLLNDIQQNHQLHTMNFKCFLV